jgi:hypothetical protein
MGFRVLRLLRRDLFCGAFAMAAENKCGKIMMKAVNDYFTVLSYHSPAGRELS